MIPKHLTPGDIRWIEKTTEEAFTPRMNHDDYIRQRERENELWLTQMYNQKQ